MGRMGIDVILKEQAILVGGFNPSEKYQSTGMIIPNHHGKINFMFQTTNQHMMP